MISILCLIAVAGLIAAILSLMGRCPIGVAVILIAIAEVLHCLPLR